ncbi:hypothetical protein KPH14_012525 [Odynerus spinipes]|uniref:Neurofilament heavy polypeptide-like n=1 Tax=Odynerus spinipes TaxID=1348599 RepID=A0AAD9VMQ4_9HYME|nr:hypothetical protein KPH14_012525 [Odynerus spinipes]
MDYRQKMVLAPQQKFKNDDDDDEDLEALRLAALQSLRTKDPLQNKKQPLTQLQKVVPQVTQITRPPYKTQRLPRRGYFHNRLQQRQNGNLYYQSPRNPNLIAIVPVDEHSELQHVEVPSAVKIEKTDTPVETKAAEESKFHRYKDTGSGSEEDDQKGHINNTTTQGENIKPNSVENDDSAKEIENQTEATDDVPKHEEEEGVNDDDDDILLMADLEEEDSLERLMDEMEREMNVDKPMEKRERESSKKENKQSDEIVKIQEQKKNEESSGRKENDNHAASLITNLKNERRSVSPHVTSGVSQKRRSLSPKSRPRKKSPRRSPRRSPLRQTKKSQRETTRYRSPRKSPSRYSPRARSPKLSPRARSPKLSPRARSPRLSPRRSPNRSPLRRSPHRKLSPRIRSPKLSPHSRSPKLLRSRSPRISSRSKSPRPMRSPKITSRSPRLTRSRSPRCSPLRLSPQPRSRSKSPRQSPRRLSPSKRLSPRSRSPGLSPRRGSPRLRSPKISPRRISPRLRSPRISPRRSPWSSPRNSPRLSPRRRRSPKWSPKEVPRKHGPCSVSPENTVNSVYVRDSPPIHKRRSPPEPNREKTKQKEESFEKVESCDVAKETTETISDPVLEARRRKFESTRPIDPVHANKKIKLSNASKKAEVLERIEPMVSTKKVNKVAEDDYNIKDRELCLDTPYEFEELEDTMENTSPIPISSCVNPVINVESSKGEKERSSKKKKKRDKEIYQVGKLKKVQNEDVDAIFEDIAVDEEGDLRAELSRRRAERLNRSVPIQSARLVQSAFKGVVNEVVKNNAKVNQRHVIKNDEKVNQKDVRRVTVVHRSVSELHDSEDESSLDSKVPVRFRLGLNKQVQDTRETKVSRKTSKRQNRKE